MNVSFIGSGNLAWHLAPALDNTDFPVREIYSQTPAHAEALADRLYQADVRPSLDFSQSTSQIFIVAVSDDVIADVVQEIILPEKAILVHTSGSQPLSVLADVGTFDTGVFYPLQTFSKTRKIDFNDVPFFIESENENVEKILMRMARALTKKVFRISSTDRKALHVAAVFAANFTNHMLTIAHGIMNNHELNFDYLKPLIAETITKAITLGPEHAQTGPAKRGDLEILDKHMLFLEEDEAVSEIYKTISQHIVDTYQS